MKKKNNGELTEQQKSFFRKAVKDPVLFANRILGMDLSARGESQ